MKNIRKIIIICLIFILSGCSVEYNLTINEDYSVSEKVVAKEKTKKMESLTRLKDKTATTYLYNMYKRNNSKINFSTKNDKTNTYGTATTNHTNIDEYSNKFTSDIFNKPIITKNNGIVTLTMIQKEVLSNEDSSSLVYDDIKINIITPFKVVENNADKISGNTYTWNIKKEEKIKTIKISYDEGNIRNSLNLKINNKTYNIHYGIIISSGIILLALIIVLVVYVKNKKNNIV